MAPHNGMTQQRNRTMAPNNTAPKNGTQPINTTTYQIRTPRAALPFYLRTPTALAI